MVSFTSLLVCLSTTSIFLAAVTKPYSNDLSPEPIEDKMQDWINAFVKVNDDLRNLRSSFDIFDGSDTQQIDSAYNRLADSYNETIQKNLPNFTEEEPDKLLNQTSVFKKTIQETIRRMARKRQQLSKQYIGTLIHDFDALQAIARRFGILVLDRTAQGKLTEVRKQMDLVVALWGAGGSYLWSVKRRLDKETSSVSVLGLNDPQITSIHIEASININSDHIAQNQETNDPTSLVKGFARVDRAIQVLDSAFASFTPSSKEKIFKAPDN